MLSCCHDTDIFSLPDTSLQSWKFSLQINAGDLLAAWIEFRRTLCAGR